MPSLVLQSNVKVYRLLFDPAQSLTARSCLLHASAARRHEGLQRGIRQGAHPYDLGLAFSCQPLTQLSAEVLGKPLKYIAVCYEYNESLSFAGTFDPAFLLTIVGVISSFWITLMHTNSHLRRTAWETSLPNRI